jgi:hypothetical protein
VDRALYFPYMRVPNRPALARVLLYLDQVSVIWPEEGPSPRSEHMRHLLASGLAVRVDPRRLHDHGELASEFKQLLESTTGIVDEQRSGDFAAEPEMEEFPAAVASPLNMRPMFVVAGKFPVSLLGHLRRTASPRKAKTGRSSNGEWRSCT